MSKGPKQVVVDITIAAPLDVVWAALRDPEQIANWFGWDAPSLAEEIKFIFIYGAEADEASGVVQFGEWEGSSDAIELTREGDGTRLRLVRSGGAPIDWTGVYEDISQGWVNFFEQLRLALELHPEQKRRTVYLSGPALEGVGEPSAELHLGEAASLERGEAYAAQLPTGDSASGIVWYQTHFQTALTVEQWGNGLLVVTDMGSSPKRPHGGGSVLLTSYGLSDDAFADLEQRWTAWWTARYPKPAA